MYHELVVKYQRNKQPFTCKRRALTPVTVKSTLFRGLVFEMRFWKEQQTLDFYLVHSRGGLEHMCL